MGKMFVNLKMLKQPLITHLRNQQLLFSKFNLNSFSESVIISLCTHILYVPPKHLHDLRGEIFDPSPCSISTLQTALPL